MKKSIFIIFLGTLIANSFAFARPLGRVNQNYAGSPLSWDIGGGFGSYDGYSYSELDVGLNYRFVDNFNWRNVLWTRLGNSFVSSTGLDSSLRWEYAAYTAEGNGVRFYAGPGVRVATQNYSGVFAEAGGLVRMGGLNVGLGVKEISYFSPGKDPVSGAAAPGQDTILMVILSGGGAF